MNECRAGLFEASPAERPCRNNGSGKWSEFSDKAFRQLRGERADTARMSLTGQFRKSAQVKDKSVLTP
jgi:hypothetical protein